MTDPARRYEKRLIDAGVGVARSAESCAMYSSVTGQRITPSELSPCYWRTNMVSTVEFFQAFENCVRDHASNCMVIEIGPHPALKGPVQDILREIGMSSTTEYMCTSTRGNDGFETLLTSAGRMIECGVPLETANINGEEVVHELNCSFNYGSVLTDLPNYQWDHSKSFWAESTVSRNIRFRKHRRHELLGSRYLEETPMHPSWRNYLMLKEIPWLMQLKVSLDSFHMTID